MGASNRRGFPLRITTVTGSGFQAVSVFHLFVPPPTFSLVIDLILPLPHSQFLTPDEELSLTSGPACPCWGLVDSLLQFFFLSGPVLAWVSTFHGPAHIPPSGGSPGGPGASLVLLSLGHAQALVVPSGPKPSPTPEFHQPLRAVLTGAPSLSPTY